MSWSKLFLDIEFQKAGKILGESEYAGFEKQIVLLDFDWDMKIDQQVKNGATVKRTVKMNPIKLSKRFDAASISLLNCLRSRDPIVSGRITVAHRVGDGGTPRKAFVLEFKKARLESVDLDMTAEGKSMILQEDIEIRYTQMKIEVYKRNLDGSYVSTASNFSPSARNNLDMVQEG